MHPICPFGVGNPAGWTISPRIDPMEMQRPHDAGEASKTYRGLRAWPKPSAIRPFRTSLNLSANPFALFPSDIEPGKIETRNVSLWRESGSVAPRRFLEEAADSFQ